MNSIKQITCYFREAIKAKECDSIDLAGQDKCWLIQPEAYKSGCLSPLLADEIFEFKSPQGWKPDYVDVLLIPKTLRKLTDEEGVEIDRGFKEITGLYYIPAKLSCLGHLYIVPAEGKRPWIPRELLHPMVEPQLCIGTTEQYNKALESNLSSYTLIETWQAYREYAEKFFESVTGAPFDAHSLSTGLREDGKTLTVALNPDIYLCLNPVVHTTHHLLKLYNELVDDTSAKPLYEKLLNGEKKSCALLPPDSADAMGAHAGQMNSRYPLSATQREALDHFRQLEKGEILAVSGPPGTGKTTLLQSVVADLFVGRALEKGPAPLIVAASTNNQAITNIIRSFGSIRKTSPQTTEKPMAETDAASTGKTISTSPRTAAAPSNPLEERWLCGIDSFAVYFPSENKLEQARQEGFQCTTRNADHFAAALETVDNLEASEKRMLEKCNVYFHRTFPHIDACQSALHTELKMIEHTRKKCLKTFEAVQTLTGNLSARTYREKSASRRQALDLAIRETEEHITEAFLQIETYKTRMQAWRACYHSLPWFTRHLSFLPAARRKIQAAFRTEKTPEELAFLPPEPSLDHILEAYSYRIQEVNEQINGYRRQIETCRTQQTAYAKKEQQLNQLLATCEAQFGVLANYNPDLFYSPTEKGETLEEPVWKSLLSETGQSGLNGYLDTTARYIAFWLAVHYYECEWLKKKEILSDGQRGYNYKTILDHFYSRLAMITPCMVMTLYMLPKNFLAYDGNEKKSFHLFNYIDLLIVEEAGQVTPEIATPAFSLAQRALVIGDESQIPPVWGIPGAVDKALAIEYGVIENKEEFARLAESGLNCSASNMMKVAKNACKYNKEPFRGLFLSEHRRCYNEIIGFCNQLIYKEKLQPKRGNGKDDPHYPLPHLPQMGYKNILSEHAAQAGVSRCNKAEAQAIVEWVKANYLAIRRAYETADSRIKPEEILAVITPFKAQSQLIRSYLSKVLPREAAFISVGTVHTFQGAERKVVIFSTVYGTKDSGYFIERNPNLVNVAVSRAQDSFLIFGARDALRGEVGRLLKSHAPTELTLNHPGKSWS